MANEDAIKSEEDKSDPGLHRTGINAPTMIDMEKLADKVSQLMRMNCAWRWRAGKV